MSKPEESCSSAFHPNYISKSDDLSRPAYRVEREIAKENRINIISTEKSCENFEEYNVSREEIQNRALKNIGNFENVNGPEKFGEGMSFQERVEKIKSQRSCGIQAHYPYRSKPVMCKPECKDFACDVKPETVEVACSTKSISISSSNHSSVPTKSSSSSNACGKSDSSFLPSSSGSTSNFSDEVLKNEIKYTAVKVTTYFQRSQSSILECYQDVNGLSI